ncbi:MAG: cyclic nucleotide-binding domain-containing protein [Pyrinomonadaceae bacterium]
MATSNLQRSATFFVVLAAGVIAALTVLPFIETAIRSLAMDQMGISVGPDGQMVSADGAGTGIMTVTVFGLLLNLFTIAKIVLWMVLVIIIVRFIFLLLMMTSIFKAGHSEVASLFKTVVSIVIYIVAFFIIFQSHYPKVELAPLFTGSTIVGIVVGLALQDTLGNLFAGIALQADQPFQVGDVVALDSGRAGVVESVSWRGVRIRTFQNKLIIMSNAVLGKEAIEVAPKDNLNARLVFFNTLYTDSPAKTVQVVRDAVRQVENVSPKKRPIVRIRDLGESGIDWEIKYWAEDYAKYNETDALIRQRVWYAFSRENIGFAFPTRTVHIQSAPAELTAEENLNSTVDLLSRVPIFSPLSESELDQLAKGSRARVFAPGEPIVKLGREGNSMFIITRGSVDVQILQAGESMTINTLRHGDYFGEMSLLTGEPRSATVAAKDETEVLQIGKETLKPIFEANPDLVKAVYEEIEQRREALQSEEEGTAEVAKRKSGVVLSIKKFFGIK